MASPLQATLQSRPARHMAAPGRQKCAPRRGCAADGLPRLPAKPSIRTSQGRARQCAGRVQPRNDKRAAQRFRRHQHRAGELAAGGARRGRERCSAPPGRSCPWSPSSAPSSTSSGCSQAKVAGFHGVDTVYHDRQHTLDITLALARLHGRLRAPGRKRRSASGPSAPSSASSPGCSTTSATCAARRSRARATAPSSRARTSRAARASWRNTCPSSASAPGCRSPPKSSTSPATKCPSPRSRPRSPTRVT